MVNIGPIKPSVRSCQQIGGLGLSSKSSCFIWYLFCLKIELFIRPIGINRIQPYYDPNGTDLNKVMNKYKCSLIFTASNRVYHFIRQF